MTGNKPKIVNLLGQRKIQSLDFLLNLGKAYINFSESHYLTDFQIKKIACKRNLFVSQNSFV